MHSDRTINFSDPINGFITARRKDVTEKQNKCETKGRQSSKISIRTHNFNDTVGTSPSLPNVWGWEKLKARLCKC